LEIGILAAAIFWSNGGWILISAQKEKEKQKMD
jgi:hypothetical protein